jgi:hypothetical protein
MIVQLIVRDAEARPQQGITVMLDAGDGRGVASYVTDATGATPRISAPTGVVTVTRVLDRDTTPLSFEMTTLDGLLVIPLHGDLDVPWAYDPASRSVLTLPRTMRNEAFPELEVLPEEADGQATVPVTRGADEAVPTLVGVDPSEPEPARSGGFWIVLAGLILGGVGLGVLAWVLARAPRRRAGSRNHRAGR